MVTSISYGRAFSWLGLLSGSHTTREVTPHARTAMELIQQFVPVRFEIASDHEADARRLRGRPRNA
jgi:RNA 3'-terminal phosphate cyclase